MWPARMFLLILILLTGISSGSTYLNDYSLGTTITKLFDKVRRAQLTKSQGRSLPFRWRKDKGVYPSYVMLNFHGPPELALLRRNLQAFDNNMFITAWTTTCLLEAFKYGKLQGLNEKPISLALNLIASHRDRNRDYDNSIMNFWPQVKNQTVNYWQNTPTNLLGLFEISDYLPWKTIEIILKTFGLGDISEMIRVTMKER